MSLVDLIVKEIKRIADVIKKNTLAKVSIGIALMLTLRKIVLMRRATPEQVKIIAETISSFY